jgi:hypothetical protein
MRSALAKGHASREGAAWRVPKCRVGAEGGGLRLTVRPLSSARTLLLQRGGFSAAGTCFARSGAWAGPRAGQATREGSNNNASNSTRQYL